MVRPTKFIALLLSVVMLFALAAIPASAEANAEPPAELDVTYAAGTVTVKLLLTEDLDFAAIGGSLTWPAELGAQATSVSSEISALADSVAENGNVVYTNMRGNNISAEAGTAIASFEFAAELTAGVEYDFTFTFNAGSYVDDAHAKHTYDWNRGYVDYTYTIPVEAPVELQTSCVDGVGTVSLVATEDFEIAGISGTLTWPEAMAEEATEVTSDVAEIAAAEAIATNGNLVYANMRGENISVSAGDAIASFIFEGLEEGTYPVEFTLTAASYVNDAFERVPYAWHHEEFSDELVITTETDVLTLNANGGTPRIQVFAFDADGYAILDDYIEPINGNATFLGWYTERNAGDLVDIFMTPFEESTTLYAHWYIPQDYNPSVPNQDYVGPKNEIDNSTTPDDNPNPFLDVSKDAWYYDAVIWAVKNGITSGITATTFGPDVSCTRAQAVTFIYRAAGSPDVEISSQFADVSADAYYAKAVSWAVAQGITQGKESGFAPDDTCTRAEIVTFLARYAKVDLAASSSSKFVDVAGTWFEGPVAWAVNNNVTQGTSATTFDPYGVCTRAQIVTLMYRARTILNFPA